MQWGTSMVLKKTSNPVDIIYDLGSQGKEPIIRILGNNPEDLFKKLNKIIISDE